MPHRHVAGAASALNSRPNTDHALSVIRALTVRARPSVVRFVRGPSSAPSVRRRVAERASGVPEHDVRAAARGGADVMWMVQARAKSMATGTGLLTMSRTGE